MNLNITVKVLEIGHQRNGVSGQPFYTVSFKSTYDNQTELLIATIEEGQGRATCRVINPLDITAKYRGDEFYSYLQESIEKYNS